MDTLNSDLAKIAPGSEKREVARNSGSSKGP